MAWQLIQHHAPQLHYNDSERYKWTQSDFTITPSGVQFTLSLLLRPLDVPADVTVVATLPDGSKKDLHGRLLLGGEKIVINEACWIVDQLLNGSEVDLQVDQYKTSLKPDNFNELWSDNSTIYRDR